MSLRNSYKVLFSFALILSAIAGYAQRAPDQFSHLSVRDGLPHNQVNCIYKDSKGFIWFGTLSGLAKYNGFDFKVYKHSVSDSTTLDDNDIRSISEGPDGLLWVQSRKGFSLYDERLDRFQRKAAANLRKFSITENKIRALKKFGNTRYLYISMISGFYHYNSQTKKLDHINHVIGKTNTINAVPIVDIGICQNGDLWVLHADLALERLDHADYSVKKRIVTFSNMFPGENATYKVFVDRQDGIWIYDLSNPIGAFYIDPVSYAIQKLNRSSEPVRLNSNVISGIVQAADDKIWIATDHGGINILDKKTNQITYALNSENDPKSLGQNNLTTIYCDDLGTIWAGTYRRGVSYFHPGGIKFQITRIDGVRNSLEYNDINAVTDAGKGRLWIGTNGKGLCYYDRTSKLLKNLQHDPENPNSISNDAIVSITKGKGSELWIGTYGGGLDLFDGSNFRHFSTKSTGGRLSNDRVSGVLKDSFGRFWVTTMGGGINLLDERSQQFKVFLRSPGHLESNYIFNVLEDDLGNIWFATGYGLSVLKRNKSELETILSKDNGGNELINNSVNILRKDNRGNLWIGTREGLSIYNIASNHFYNFTVKDGLPSNNIQSIEPAGSHEFWISTSNGLSKAIVADEQRHKIRFINFDEYDGLQGKEFNRSASCRLSSGELAFAGADGLNIFQPAGIRNLNSKSALVFTDLFLFNQPVKVDEKAEGSVVLRNSINETGSITLNSHQNVFTIAFASLNYLEPHKVKYQYMLSGFDKNWITPDDLSRKATYTNLDAGNYKFLVRASDPDGVWDADLKQLEIHILPPFYKSTLAYILYIISFGIVLYLVRRRGIQKLRSQFSAEQEKRELQISLEQERQAALQMVEQERVEALRIRELDASKIKFITNISHEFRTPLSLILAPVEKILHTKDLHGHLQEQFVVIQNNAARLLNLVNQLLDFRKMEAKQLMLQKSNGEFVSFVKEIVLSFKDLADKKNVDLSFNSMIGEYTFPFDREKIERVLLNILSNSFKFTLENGKVAVFLQTSEHQDSIEVKIRDTGIGIAQDQQEKIFGSFYQIEMPDSIVNQGSGIGLSIAKEFAELHGGHIEIESEPGFGSCFTLILPIPAGEDLKDDAKAPVEAPCKAEQLPGQGEVTPREQKQKKATILLVEDDADLRHYLKNSLGERYLVIEANNGKDGWQKTLFHHPAAVVTDITMPEMNGVELCKKIKSDERTRHLPVILLTAVNGLEQQLYGLESGANDYITKPFSVEILQAKLSNVLSQQESFKKTYQKRLEIKPPEVEVETPDEKFLQELIDYLEKNIANSNFSVDELSNLVLVSRVTLYKRIVALTGKTPLEFIKSFRLQRAAQLLEKGNFTVSQITYKVGFKTTKNFVRSFKNEFGMIPTKYLDSRTARHEPAE